MKKVTEVVTRLRLAYRASGWTMAQIGARACLHEWTVKKVLAGGNVTAESLFAVCRALDVSTLPVPAEQKDATRSPILKPPTDAIM